MFQLMFVTGNAEKFNIARAVCKPLGVSLERKRIDIDEIQGEDSDVIVRDKVSKAFNLLKRPVVVGDDSWNIPGLNGFPGPYMKSMDHWFRPEDFLNLTRTLSDRRIILVQLLAYQDEGQQRVFRNEYICTLLTESRGNYGKPLQKVVAMPGDEGLSIAEAYDKGVVHVERDVAEGWRQLVAWHTHEFAT